MFELLSHSLYDVLRATRFRGVSLGLTRKFSRQIFSALSYLRSHGLVHCDLKPENVLLCSTDRTAVKLIDFGELVLGRGDERFHLRAEPILPSRRGDPRLAVRMPADVWSLGCIMVELHSGKPLFPGKDEREQLRKITEALGEVPREMVERCAPERRARAFRFRPGSEFGRETARPRFESPPVDHRRRRPRVRGEAKERRRGGGGG